jgi:hypothetical protein
MKEETVRDNQSYQKFVFEVVMLKLLPVCKDGSQTKSIAKLHNYGTKDDEYVSVRKFIINMLS